MTAHDPDPPSLAPALNFKIGHSKGCQALLRLGFVPIFVTALVMLILSSIAQQASAHEVRPLIATLEAEDDGSVDIILSINLEAAIAGIGPEHEDTSESAAAPVYDRLRELPSEALQKEFGDFASRFFDGVELGLKGDAVPLMLAEIEIPPVGNTAVARISRIVLTGQAPVDGRNFTWRLDRSLGDSVIRVRQPGTEEILYATHVPAGETAGPLSLSAPQEQTTAEVSMDYLWIGFTHILPKGLDHILFVIGLFLLSSRLSTLVWQVSAFTVAHTLTIALGTLGIVNVPASIVEPLIALSIAWIGIENMMTVRLHSWRLTVVFGFGLLHGLGFASVLQEIGLTTTHFAAGLIAFNVGVELGQLTVIALCFLFVGWFMRWHRYRQVVVIPGSLAITVVALFWVVERTLLA